jgi:hypothetical protein
MCEERKQTGENTGKSFLNVFFVTVIFGINLTLTRAGSSDRIAFNLCFCLTASRLCDF